MSKVKADLRYTAEHEWVRVEGATAVVGITDHAQAALGDLTYIELPKVGTQVTRMKPCGTVESVKAASELFSPLSGTVAAVNSAAAESPEVVNQDCYGAGWLVKITLSAPAELGQLLDAASYQKLLG